jgi:hydrogenase/urease accessory protein HupE
MELYSYIKLNKEIKVKRIAGRIMLFVLSMLATGQALAHEGVGHNLVANIIHLVTEPEHLLVLLAVAIVLPVIWRRHTRSKAGVRMNKPE